MYPLLALTHVDSKIINTERNHRKKRECYGQLVIAFRFYLIDLSWLKQLSSSCPVGNQNVSIYCLMCKTFFNVNILATCTVTITANNELLFSHAITPLFTFYLSVTELLTGLITPKTNHSENARRENPKKKPHRVKSMRDNKQKFFHQPKCSS